MTNDTDSEGVTSRSVMSNSLGYNFDNSVATQLLCVDEEGHIVLHEDGIRILKTLQTVKLFLIGAIGPYRLGKSFLLNELACLDWLENSPPSRIDPMKYKSDDTYSQNHSFEVGATIASCKNGVWIRVSSVSSNSAVVLVDCEGSGNCNPDTRGSSLDYSMSVACMLLCRDGITLYNTSSVLDSCGIENLSKVCNVARESIHKIICDGTVKFTLIWVLRDFSLKLLDDMGDPITPDAYFEETIQSSTNDSHRHQIESFFQERRFFPVSCPFSESDDDTQITPIVNRKPEFMTNIRKLQKIITQDATIGLADNSLTGPSLLIWTGMILNSVNTQSGIRAQSARDTYLEEIAVCALHEVKRYFDLEIKKEMGNTLNKLDMRKHLLGCRRKSIQKANEYILSLSGSPKYFDQWKRDLYTHMERSEKLFQEQNLTCCKTLCQSILLELLVSSGIILTYKQFAAHEDTPTPIGFERAISKLKIDFMSHPSIRICHEDATDVAWSEFYARRLAHLVESTNNRFRVYTKIPVVQYDDMNRVSEVTPIGTVTQETIVHSETKTLQGGVSVIEKNKNMVGPRTENMRGNRCMCVII